MTKEELKKEANLKYRTGSYPQLHPDWRAFEHGYLAGAEPREKRIAELKAEVERLKLNEQLAVNNGKVLLKENAELKEQKAEYVECRNKSWRKRRDKQKEINYFTGFDDGYHECQKEHKWHYVKDGDLPKDENYVLVSNGKDWTKGFYKDKKWNIISLVGFTKIIAWKEIDLMSLVEKRDHDDKLAKAKELLEKMYYLYFEPCVTHKDLENRDKLFEEVKQFIKE